MSIVLREISPADAEAVAPGRCPEGVAVTGFSEPGVLEIGYAVVESARGRGYATQAVRAVVERARELPEIRKVVGHTPLDRPNSGRLLEKAGFTIVGEIEEEHEGQVMRVQRGSWRCRRPSSRARSGPT